MYRLCHYSLLVLADEKMNFIPLLLLKVIMLYKYGDGRARAPATLVVKTTVLSEQ